MQLLRQKIIKKSVVDGESTELGVMLVQEVLFLEQLLDQMVSHKLTVIHKLTLIQLIME